jgi:hypothetical protein
MWGRLYISGLSNLSNGCCWVSSITALQLLPPRKESRLIGGWVDLRATWTRWGRDNLLPHFLSSLMVLTTFSVFQLRRASSLTWEFVGIIVNNLHFKIGNICVIIICKGWAGSLFPSSKMKHLWGLWVILVHLSRSPACCKAPYLRLPGIIFWGSFP